MSVAELVDLDYLQAACRRADHPLPTKPIDIEPLADGRTGAEVLKLTSGERRFVLKVIPTTSWRGPGMGRPDGGEPSLWRHGAVRSIDAPIAWPVLDLSPSDDGAQQWLLMRDVGPGVRGRGEFSLEDSGKLFDAMAQMHASFFGHPALETVPLPSTSGVTKLFTTPLETVGRGTEPAEPWVSPFLSNFQVMGVFAPLFFDSLGTQLADEFLTLAADPTWKEAIDALPATFLHGDLRRANIAFENGTVQLFDWELACLGPPGSDLQWHCFLHYWGYPPEGMAPGDDCEGLRQRYVDRLRELQGNAFDPDAFDAGWKLGWIKVVAQLGYILADPLYPDGGSPEQREKTRALCTKAVRRALEMRAAMA